MATPARPRRVLGPAYGPSIGSYIFLLLTAFSDLFSAAKESRRYGSSWARVFAGFGPPLSHAAGGVLPSSSAANAKFEQATCLICSAKVRSSVGPNGAASVNLPAITGR